MVPGPRRQPAHAGACTPLQGRGLSSSECGWRLCLCPGVCPPGQAPDLLGLAGSRPPALGIAQSWSSQGLHGVWRANGLEFHIVGDDGALSQPPPSLGLSSFGPWHAARLMGGCLLNARFWLTMKPALSPWLAGEGKKRGQATGSFFY